MQTCARQDVLSRLRVAQHAQGHGHHEAITLLNLAYHQKVRGDARAALQHADDAVSLLAGDASSGEMAAASAVRGWALAHLGDLRRRANFIELRLTKSTTQAAPRSC